MWQNNFKNIFIVKITKILSVNLKVHFIIVEIFYMKTQINVLKISKKHKNMDRL